MVGADEQAAEVGDHQADEGDRAGDGGRGAAEDDGARRGDQARAGHVLAEPGREVVAQSERVHAASAQQADQRADDEDRQHQRDAIPGRAADAADLPEPERLHHVDAGEQDGAGQRGERRGRRRAGERELERRRAAAAERADGVDEDRRAGGAGDGEPDVGVRDSRGRRTRSRSRPPARRPPRCRGCRDRRAGCG